MITYTAILSFLFTAQAAPAADTAKNAIGSQFIFPVVLIIIFYFLLIRPQQRQRKELAARIASLQSGDKVVTSAGLHGIIHTVKEHTTMVKIAEGITVEFDKASITTIQKKDSSVSK